jgi:hypothetical protein
LRLDEQVVQSYLSTTLKTAAPSFPTNSFVRLFILVRFEGGKDKKIFVSRLLKIT